MAYSPKPEHDYHKLSGTSGTGGSTKPKLYHLVPNYDASETYS